MIDKSGEPSTADVESELAAMAREGDPWARFWRAAQRGTGLRLSAADVDRLASDNAIQAAASFVAVRRIEERQP